MAIDDTGAAPADTAAAKSGSLLKAVGITFGLFAMMLLTQLVSPIIGCKVFASVTPGCAAPAPAVDAKGKPAEKPKAPPIYIPMDPPLVVSLTDNGAIRFLQVTIELMTRDEKMVEQVKTHMPVIRNNLLMMLGGQPLTALTNREDKEQLRQQSLGEVQKILKANAGSDGVEELYFTSFVVQ